LEEAKGDQTKSLWARGQRERRNVIRAVWEPGKSVKERASETTERYLSAEKGNDETTAKANITMGSKPMKGKTKIKKFKGWQAKN